MTTIHKKDIEIRDGEIYIFAGIGTMIGSTKKHENPNMILLNRNHFVKPKEDVEELALNNMGYSTENFDNEDWVQVGYFISGYKANKAEFTMEEMFKCFMAGLKSVDKVGRNEELFDKHINAIRQLSIPEYIVIDNDEILEVKW